MSQAQDATPRRRPKRVLSAQEKHQIYLQLLTGELSQRQAAERWGVDATTVMRICRVGREGPVGGWAVGVWGAPECGALRRGARAGCAGWGGGGRGGSRGGGVVQRH